MSGELPVCGFSFRRMVPALRIFEAVGLGLSPISIVVAIVASVLLSLSGWLVDKVLPLDADDPIVNILANHLPFLREVDQGDRSFAFEALVRPWTSVTRPVVRILHSVDSRNVLFNGVARFSIALALWSWVGLVLCRRSAFLFVEDDESTLKNAVEYSFKRWPAAAGAPMIPLATAMMIGLIAAGFGFVGRLPFLGSPWLLAFSPLALVFGFCMAFLALATAVTWPLMVAAVAVDDCDGFGGLSRAYSGLTGRPWQFLGYSVVGLIAGGVLMLVVDTVAQTTIWCAMSGTQFGSGPEPARDSLLIPLTRFVKVAVSAVGISTFWSIATVVYLLMRLEIDGVPFDRIALDDDKRPIREALPVVGIPATDARSDLNGNESSPSQ